MVRAHRETIPNSELVVSRFTSEDEQFEDEVLKLICDADVIVSSDIFRKHMEVAKRLRMIQTLGTGHNVDLDAAVERRIVVCTAVGLNAVSVAEHAMALMLNLSKNITMFDRELRELGWKKATSSILIMMLQGKTLGIIGLGSIGEEIVKRAKPFGMRIIATKKHPSEELRIKLGLDFLGGTQDLPRVARESDFIILSVYFTPETKGMIGERELRMMKKSAYLINISRGAVVDEKALVKVLTERAIVGAGLDVFEVEPVKPDNPLLKLDNATLTPHRGGGAEGQQIALKVGLEERSTVLKEQAEFVFKNIDRFLKGEEPLNKVDSKLSYVVFRAGH